MHPIHFLSPTNHTKLEKLFSISNLTNSPSPPKSYPQYQQSYGFPQLTLKDLNPLSDHEVLEGFILLKSLIVVAAIPTIRFMGATSYSFSLSGHGLGKNMENNPKSDMWDFLAQRIKRMSNFSSTLSLAFLLNGALLGGILLKCIEKNLRNTLIEFNFITWLKTNE